MPPKKRVRGGGAAGSNVVPVVGTSALSLFTSRPVQVAVQGSELVEYLPSNTYNRASDVVFDLPGNNTQWFDLQSARINVEFKVENADTTQLGANDEVAPIAVLGAALFKNVEMRVGDTVATAYQNGLYSYLGYFDTLFRSSHDFKDNNNYNMFIFADTQGEFDANSVRNGGFRSRRTRVSGSIKCFLRSPIFVPLCQQTKYMVPGVNLQFRYRIHENKFLLNSFTQDPTQVLLITKISMTIVRKTLNASLHSALMSHIRTTPAVYNVLVPRLVEFSRVDGTQVIDQVVLGPEARLPLRAFVFLLDTTRVLGRYDKSPFNIQWRDLKQVYFSSGSTIFPQGKPLDVDLPLLDVQRAYLEMIRLTGAEENTSGLSFDDFAGGYGVIAVDLSRSGLSGDDIADEASQKGPLNIHLEFRTALQVSITVIILFEGSGSIYVQGNESVSLDYTP